MTEWTTNVSRFKSISKCEKRNPHRALFIWISFPVLLDNFRPGARNKTGISVHSWIQGKEILKFLQAESKTWHELNAALEK